MLLLKLKYYKLTAKISLQISFSYKNATVNTIMDKRRDEFVVKNIKGFSKINANL